MRAPAIGANLGAGLLPLVLLAACGAGGACAHSAPPALHRQLRASLSTSASIGGGEGNLPPHTPIAAVSCGRQIQS